MAQVVNCDLHIGLQVITLSRSRTVLFSVDPGHQPLVLMCTCGIGMYRNVSSNTIKIVYSKF